jgi:hypothetical protein
MRTRDTGAQHDYLDEDEDEERDYERDSDDEHRFDEERHVPETKYPRDRSRVVIITAKTKGDSKPSPIDDQALDRAAALIGDGDDPPIPRKPAPSRRDDDLKTPAGRDREARRRGQEQEGRKGRLKAAGQEVAADVLTDSPIKGIAGILRRIAAGEDIDLGSLLGKGKSLARDAGGAVSHGLEGDLDSDTEWIQDLDRNDPMLGDDLARYDKLQRDLDDISFRESEDGDRAVEELDEIIERLQQERE